MPAPRRVQKKMADRSRKREKADREGEINTEKQREERMLLESENPSSHDPKHTHTHTEYTTHTHTEYTTHTQSIPHTHTQSIPHTVTVLAFAREVLMFSIFSILAMQLFCTLLHANRM